MNALRFSVPGEPQPWRRARLGRNRKTGATFHFTDARTADYEASWSREATDALSGADPLTGPIRAEIVARFMAPKSLTKKRRAAIVAGLERPTRRPDADNLAKNLDGLNGVAFRDDAQVVELIVSKVYAASAGVDVTLTPLSEPVT